MRDIYSRWGITNSTKRLTILGLIFILFSLLAAGCGSNSTEETHAYQLAPVADMHPYVQSAPVTVQQAYQFAHANPEMLKQVPCYCGCGAMGHTSNYSCYINETDGEKVFDGHALGCSICVDITQDVMRLMDNGHPISYIKEFVDKKYSAFGPSNIP